MSLFPPRAAVGRSPYCSPHAAEARSLRSVPTRLALAARVCTLCIAAAARRAACAPCCPYPCTRAAAPRLATGRRRPLSAGSRSGPPPRARASRRCAPLAPRARTGKEGWLEQGTGASLGGGKHVGMVEVGSGWLVRMLGRIGLGVE
jgi:hypothetical protein